MKKKPTLVRLLGGYFRTYRYMMGLYLLLCAIFVSLHFLGWGTLRELSYSLTIAGVALAVAFWLSFRRYAKHLRLLWQAQENPPPEPTALPEGATLAEESFRQMAVAYGKEYHRQGDLARQADTERTDYYTLWVHQIKTPIAALKLIAQSEKPINREMLGQEIFKIDQYADAALTYQRLTSIRSDLELEDVPLYPLCCKVVKRLRPLFAYRKIQLSMAPFAGTVLSDEKWLAMVLEQVLTNGLKYTPEGGQITISQPGPTQLAIKDTGIGIRPEDVPRVFERGFTGSLGRTSDKSTGIGLYLCKQACDLLGHHISLTSIPDGGTTVILDMRREALEAF